MSRGTAEVLSGRVRLGGGRSQQSTRRGLGVSPFCGKLLEGNESGGPAFLLCQLTVGALRRMCCKGPGCRQRGQQTDVASQGKNALLEGRSGQC